MSRVCQPLTSIIYVQAGDARGRGRGAPVCARHTVRTPRYASRVSDILIPPSCIPTASPTISSRRRRHRRHRHRRRHARATSSFAIFIRVTRRVNPRAASIFALSPSPLPPPPRASPSSHSFASLFCPPRLTDHRLSMSLCDIFPFSRRDTANHVTFPGI